MSIDQKCQHQTITHVTTKYRHANKLKSIIRMIHRAAFHDHLNDTARFTSGSDLVQPMLPQALI